MSDASNGEFCRAGDRCALAFACIQEILSLNRRSEASYMVQDELGAISTEACSPFLAAREALDAVPFGQACRCVINHWLAAWDKDLFPRLADFTHGLDRGLKHALVVLEVWPQRTAIIRSAGALVQNAFGVDLTNRDWIAMTAEEDRAKRLAGITDIALGCAGRGIRVVQPKFGEPLLVEDVMLPFRDCTAQGSRFVATYHDAGVRSVTRPGEGLVVNGERLAASVTRIPLVGA